MMAIPTLQTGWVVGAIFHAALPSHQITVTAAHTTAAPLALFATMDEPPPPGTTFQTVVLMPDPTYTGLYLMGA